MKLNQGLEKGKNAFDLLRLLLASAVIVGHAPALNGTSRFFVDPVTHVFGVEYLGSLAVKLFLFISGLLVTNSLLRGKYALKFLISRAFRVLPGLASVLIVTAFVIGPLITSRDLYSYLGDPATLRYVTDNIRFSGNYSLPGVFEANLYKGAVNGSLWTLYYEVGCYLLILGLYLVLSYFGNYRFFLNTVLGVIVIDTVFFGHSLFPFLGKNPEVYHLPMMFSIGALLALNANILDISLVPATGFAFLWYVFRDADSGHAFLLISLSLFVVNLFTSKPLARVQLPIDISYGVYLWGFLIQQLVFFKFGHMQIYLHMLISLGIVYLFAILSALFIERPAIRFGAIISRKIYADKEDVKPKEGVQNAERCWSA